MLEIQQHLARAEELLLVAKELLENAHVADSISRSYYAMFHAATAVLLHLGIERSSHRAVVAAFGELVVKPGHIESRFHACFRKAFEARNECDYLPVASENLQQARGILSDATDFVAACKAFHEAKPK